MIPLPDGTFRYSPRDLVAFLEGDFAAWCERMFAERQRAGGAGPAELDWATPDEGDEELALAARKGEEHEQRWLAIQRESHPDIVELDRADPEGPARTLAAMEAGASVIYQAHLLAGGWGGFPDFLFRCEGGDCRCRGFHYTPWDTKLARSAKPGFLIQLCAYADMLEGIRGYCPDQVVFVLGDGQTQSYDTRRYYFYYRRLRRAFAGFQAGWSSARPPEPGLDPSWGRWERTAEKLLERSDHLSRVAGITRGQVRRLEEAAVPTLTALADCDPASKVPRISDPVMERLRTQARLQLQSRGLIQPLWEPRPPDPDDARRGLALLPPPSDSDVFFDMEGFPYAEGGLEYLFGVVFRDGVTPEYRDWWAHDRREERRAFEGFMDWLMERRRQDPSLHVYHYGAYEETALKHLMGKHATREAEVDELLRAGTLVDLLKVVKQGFVIGTDSYSLKRIERLYLEERTGPVLSAGGSVVEYQRWIDSGEPRGWRESALLTGIRTYNEADCHSTFALRSWLRDRQCESGIDWMPDPLRDGQPTEPDPERAAVEALAARLVERGLGRLESEPEAGRLDQLLGWLVEFHRREEKPMWWRMFERHEAAEEELREDPDCLAGLTRTVRAPWKITRKSNGFEYRYDTEQETKLEIGDGCFVAATDMRAEIIGLDDDSGMVELKSTSDLPDRVSLIPDEFVSAQPIKDAIVRFAEVWERGEVLSQAVEDLLRRHPPRITGHAGGPLVTPGQETVQRACEIAAALDRSTLCIQGPPGSGKTYTAAAMIVELLRRGKRIGVTAQSHKVIMNAMRAVVKALAGTGVPASLCKVGDCEGDDLVEQGVIAAIKNGDVPDVLYAGPCLVGGTAWLFSREELAGRFDYLFVDEAGQVSLANAVAVGPSARNLVLIGDQMQLAQVTKGHHPGDTGLSCLEYLLDGKATVPPHQGIFLEESRRMHPDVCRFVSDAVYEGRLGSAAGTERHRVIRGPGDSVVPAESGIVWVPVEHDGCAQSSDEECDAIEAIVKELLGRRVVDRQGVERPMTPDDILVVAPFNLQVRCLRSRLDPRIRIGSVDKFQGQEAPVVIVSLCASTLEEAPRGASFLLNPNRLNVAVSRAEALAVVVGCPDLMDVRCRTIEEMRLVNLLCHLVQYAEDQATPASK